VIPDSVDVLVVGGGIHGAGVLQAVAAAGYRALLLEERELASGTSSRSSKLIHGGLRYLESAQIGLVRESLAERAILLEIAPELVKLVPFFIPIYGETRRRPWQIRAGLSMYALLGNFARDARFSLVPRSEWESLDGLSTDGLQAVYRYLDGQTDDAALVRAVVRSSAALGAHALAPAMFLGATRRSDPGDGSISGYDVRFSFGARTHACRASVLVNAAGPWIERVRAAIEPRPRGYDVELVAGAHIELPGTIDRGIYYAEAPRDGRAVFLMPWHGRTLVGTTETPYQGDPRDVAPLASEIDYLRETLMRYFPRRSSKVVDAWAGLRVLQRAPGRSFDRPRDTELVCDDDSGPHMVAIYGGKLTGYRATAQKVLRLVQRTLPRIEPIADTATLVLEPDLQPSPKREASHASTSSGSYSNGPMPPL
jgi:glycerol-3-phosphate dehydrogenase